VLIFTYLNFEFVGTSDRRRIYELTCRSYSAVMCTSSDPNSILNDGKHDNNILHCQLEKGLGRRRNFSIREKNQPWYIIGKAIYTGYKIITIILYACLARRAHTKRVVFEKMWVDNIYSYIFCSAPSICFSLYVLG